MLIFPIRILLLSSLAALLSSCSREPYHELEMYSGNKECIEQFRPGFSSIRYRTHATIKNHDLNGILVLKKMENGNTRAVFAGDAGITFFDMEFLISGVKVHYIMKKLDYNAVISQLKNDIGMLLMHEMRSNELKVKKNRDHLIFMYGNKGSQTSYHTNLTCTELISIEKWGKQKIKAVASLTGYRNGLPDSISIDHNNFAFTIRLKQIEK